MNNIAKSAVLASLLSGLAALAVAHGDEHDHGRPSERAEPRAAPRAAPRAPQVAPARPAFDGRGQVLDSRYNHGRYYPPVGSLRPALPENYRPYYRGNERYYFNGGVWYAPRGPGFVVVRPPSGLVISVLPPFYSTVWFAGVPYYYADNVYYAWQPDQNGYAVVEPPPEADNPASSPDVTPPEAPQTDLIIYPKDGQSKEQQAADRFECHTWAKGQTGFDPTQPGGAAPGNPDLNRNNYNRAMSACLQARGYQVN
jgi:hypothetical protein